MHVTSRDFQGDDQRGRPTIKKFEEKLGESVNLESSEHSAPIVLDLLNFVDGIQ